MNFGVLEGKCCSKEGWDVPDSFQMFFDDPVHYQAPEGGEDFQAVRERTGDFLNWLFAQEQYRDSTVLVTTHGAAMAGLLNNLKKKPLAEYWGVGVHKNCGVTEVDVTDGRIDIISENKVYYTDVVFSGMQATGNLTLGNYLGALKNWVTLSDEYECFYSVVDMHSITVRQDPATLRKRARTLLTLYIAAGLDPEKNCIYYQSHVSAHAELAWILNCFTYMGELNRMTQFKDKSAKHADNINAGLFTYPVLMAADILLYQADVVPVGNDQKQHLEITRDIAERFNNIYGDVFTIPEGYYGKVGARIMSLQDPSRKMSKSDENPNASIYLLDDPDTIMRKCKRAVTDSEGQILYRDEQPGVKNLIDIYSACLGKTPEETVREFDGKGYGDFKIAVGEAVVSVLKPLQDEVARLEKDKAYLDGIIKANAEKAGYFANKTLRKVQKKVGFPERVR